MLILYAVCAAALIISFAVDRKKTAAALKIALKKFLKLLPAFSVMLILVSVVLYLLPESLIIKYLGGDRPLAEAGIASLIGSVTMMPGFIAFPLCGILRDNGVPWTVISAFSTSLMLVGIVSFPVEKHYLGIRISLVRNLAALLMSLLTAVAVGLAYGEFGF